MSDDRLRNLCDAARQELERQVPDDERYIPALRHWMAGVYGEHPPHDNAVHQAQCVSRMIRARAALASGAASIEAYVGVVYAVARQLVELRADALGRPAEMLANAASGVLQDIERPDADPTYRGVVVEGFVQFAINLAVLPDAEAGMKVRWGARKGGARASAGPTDHELHAAFVRVRPGEPSDRAAHLAVALEFGLPMPPSDAGRRRVYRAVKKVAAKK